LPQENTFEYIFSWKNNPERARMFGKRCRILNHGTRLRSILIEFEDGERMVVSERAVRRDDGQTERTDQLTLD
jgi:hypothetical protein